MTPLLLTLASLTPGDGGPGGGAARAPVARTHSPLIILSCGLDYLTDNRLWPAVGGNVSHLPLTIEQILIWADAHRCLAGKWPDARSGPVGVAPGQTWEAVNQSLARGGRGLPGGSSLARLLADERGKRYKWGGRLREELILFWADRHYRRTGRWPTAYSGPVRGAAGENWRALASALWAGNRGLRGGETLRRFLRRHGRDVPETRGRPAIRATVTARPIGA